MYGKSRDRMEFRYIKYGELEIIDRAIKTNAWVIMPLIIV